MHLNTHNSHTHACTHARMYTPTMHTCTHVHAHMHTCTHVHAHKHTCTHSHTHAENSHELMNALAIMVSAKFTWIPFLFLFQCGTTGRQSLISPTATNPKVVSRAETWCAVSETVFLVMAATQTTNYYDQGLHRPL